MLVVIFAETFHNSESKYIFKTLYDLNILAIRTRTELKFCPTRSSLYLCRVVKHGKGRAHKANRTIICIQIQRGHSTAYCVLHTIKQQHQIEETKLMYQLFVSNFANPLELGNKRLTFVPVKYAQVIVMTGLICSVAIAILH